MLLRTVYTKLSTLGKGGVIIIPDARMGRDRGDIALWGLGSVSIHAPAWGATVYLKT